MPDTCSDCRAELTDDETVYLGNRCERCAQHRQDRIGHWLKGADDKMLEREIW